MFKKTLYSVITTLLFYSQFSDAQTTGDPLSGCDENSLLAQLPNSHITGGTPGSHAIVSCIGVTFLSTIYDAAWLEKRQTVEYTCYMGTWYKQGIDTLNCPSTCDGSDVVMEQHERIGGTATGGIGAAGSTENVGSTITVRCKENLDEVHNYACVDGFFYECIPLSWMDEYAKLLATGTPSLPGDHAYSGPLTDDWLFECMTQDRVRNTGQYDNYWLTVPDCPNKCGDGTSYNPTSEKCERSVMSCPDLKAEYKLLSCCN